MREIPYTSRLSFAKTKTEKKHISRTINILDIFKVYDKPLIVSEVVKKHNRLYPFDKDSRNEIAKTVSELKTVGKLIRTNIKRRAKGTKRLTYEYVLPSKLTKSQKIMYKDNTKKITIKEYNLLYKKLQEIIIKRNYYKERAVYWKNKADRLKSSNNI